MKLLSHLPWILIFFSTNCPVSKLGILKKNNTNVYVWNKTMEEFINLFDQPLEKDGPKSIGEFYGSIEGSVIQVLSHNMDPYIITDPNGTFLDGFLGDMWNILEIVLRFKSNITAIRKFDHGRNMIKRHEADVFLAALVYTDETTNMDFSQPYFRNWYHLYFKLPEGKPSSYLHFEAFSGQLWSYLLSIFIFLTTTLWLTCATLRKLAPKEEVLHSLPTCFMGVISAFLNTGYDLKLRSFSARLQIFVALVFGVLCYYALSASLVASLAVLDRPIPFRTLEDLASQKTFPLCMRNITFVYDKFSHPNGTVIPKWRGIVNANRCPANMIDWTVISKSICQENVVILENRIVMGLVLQRAECQIALLPQRYFGSANYMVMSQKFRNKKAISVMLSRIRSTGVAEKLESKWVKTHVPKPPPIRQANQITFSHIKGLLLIYVAAIFFSLLILVAEMCFEQIWATFLKKKHDQLTLKTKETTFFSYEDNNIWYYK